MNFPGGDTYEGEWENDKIHGQGRWTHADGSYYEGEFAQGARVDGKFVNSGATEEYIGQWNDRVREGKGILIVKTLGKYEGDFHSDLPHGEGSFQYIDGSTYSGQWKDGMRWGTGVLQEHDTSYHGEWSKNHMNGKGILVKGNGDKYVGHFSEGHMEGKGRMVYQDGTIYDGEWKQSKRSGQGICKYSNGDKYEGQWSDDKRHGLGFCKFSDGTKFRGTWEDDGWVQSGADPVRTRIGGAGTIRGEAGKRARFIIQARDEDGNKRLNGGDEFQVQLILHGDCANPDIAENDIVSLVGEVVDNDDGTYEVTYLPKIAGIYELNVTSDSTKHHVADSPYPVRILSSKPDITKLIVQGTGRSSAGCGEMAKFEIIVRDSYGNRCSGTAWNNDVSIQVRLENNHQEFPVSLQATNDGKFLCEYKAPTQDCYCRLHIEDGKGRAAPGTPFSVTVGNTTETSILATKSSMPSDSAAKAPSTPENEHKPKTSDISLDRSKLWEEIAKTAYAADGDLSGWDSDQEETKETKEEEYARKHPNVPVVENIEDLWLVSKLQQERKKKEEESKNKKLTAIKSKLEDIYGPAQNPSMEEAQEAMKQIIQSDLEDQYKAVTGVTKNGRKHELGMRRIPLENLAATLDDLA